MSELNERKTITRCVDCSCLYDATNMPRSPDVLIGGSYSTWKECRVTGNKIDDIFDIPEYCPLLFHYQRIVRGGTVG